MKRFKDLVFVKSMIPGIKLAGITFENGMNFTVVKSEKLYSISDRDICLNGLTKSEAEVCMEQMQKEESKSIHQKSEDAIVASSTNFSSRFMPNVKFPIIGLDDKEWIKLKEEFGLEDRIGYFIDERGNQIVHHSLARAYLCDAGLEVSIYEAIPELVPDGMKWSDEFKKLVPDILQVESDSPEGVAVEMDQIQKIADTLNRRFEKLNLGEPNGESLGSLEDLMKSDSKSPHQNFRDYNVGSSDYSEHKIQPWDIWEEYKLDPWDADIVKRILRTKDGDNEVLDYEKIKHVCDKKIAMIKGESDE